MCSFSMTREVTNVIFDIRAGQKDGHRQSSAGSETAAEQGMVLTENDLVFVTNGSCTEETHLLATSDHAPNGDRGWSAPGGCWQPVEEHRRAGPGLWPSGEVLLRAWPRPTGSRPPSPPWTTRSSPYMDKGLQAGPLLREGGHRRYRQRSRTPAWLLSWTFNRQPQFKEPEPEGQLVRLGVRPLYRCARRLCEKAHAGVYRQGDHAWSGCTTWGCRRSRSRTWLAEQSASHASPA